MLNIRPRILQSLGGATKGNLPSARASLSLDSNVERVEREERVEDGEADVESAVDDSPEPSLAAVRSQRRLSVFRASSTRSA